MIEEELVKRLTLLERRVDGLIKPEVPLGMSLISDTTLAADAASIALSSIPQGFRHLYIFGELRSTAVAETDLILVRYNNDATAIYDLQALVVNNATLTGAVVRAGSGLGLCRCEGANSRANNASPQMFWVYDYARTTAEKWAMGLSCNFGDVSADADLREEFRSGRWRNTAAITTITIIMNSLSNIVAGSRIQVYGIM